MRTVGEGMDRTSCGEEGCVGNCQGCRMMLLSWQGLRMVFVITEAHWKVEGRGMLRRRVTFVCGDGHGRHGFMA